MSVFNYFTKEQRERARNTDLVQLLRSQGEKLKRSGSEFEWRDGSEKVTVRGNLWFNQYNQEGGDAIDFVRRYYNKDYPEAVAADKSFILFLPRKSRRCWNLPSRTLICAEPTLTCF